MNLHRVILEKKAGNGREIFYFQWYYFILFFNAATFRFAQRHWAFIFKSFIDTFFKDVPNLRLSGKHSLNQTYFK